MSDQLAEYVSSQNELFADANALRDWESAIKQTGINERSCYSMPLYNTRETQTLSLMSKESHGLVSKLTTRLHKHVFSVHRLILIVYAPSLLKDTIGTISIMLYHQTTGQSIDVVKMHNVGQAATFVARWPRGIPVAQKGLSLIVSTNDVQVLGGAHVGTLHPFWEDKVQLETIYEKQRPTLTYLLQEQEPAFYIKDVKVLKAAMRSKICVGGVGDDLIITHPLSLTLDKLKEQQPLKAQLQLPSATARPSGSTSRHDTQYMEVTDVAFGTVPLPEVFIGRPPEVNTLVAQNNTPKDLVGGSRRGRPRHTTPDPTPPALQ
jgi:hypothetical protein